MKAAKQKWLAGGMLGFILVIAFLLHLVAQPPTSTSGLPDARSTHDSGRRAAHLLLTELGMSASLWDQPPAALPRQGATLILPTAPRRVFSNFTFGDDDESDLDVPEHPTDIPLTPLSQSEGGGQASLELHHPVLYSRFLSEGGVLIASAEKPILRFLRDRLEIEAIDDLVVDEVSGDGAGKTILTGGDELEVEWAHEFEGPLSSEFTPWATSEDGTARIVSLPVGSGELVLIADAEVFSNESLRESDAGWLFVRLIESFDRTGNIFFDQYALGLWRPQTTLEYAFSGGFLQLSVQFSILLLLVVWRLVWIGRFPRDPEPYELVSPLLRVQSQAQILERAGRFDVLARWRLRGLVARAQKYWKINVSPRPEETEEERETRTLRELQRRSGIDVQSRRVSSLANRVRNHDALEEFDDDMDELEEQLQHTHVPKSSKARNQS